MMYTTIYRGVKVYVKTVVAKFGLLTSLGSNPPTSLWHHTASESGKRAVAQDTARCRVCHSGEVNTRLSSCRNISS